MKINTSEQLKKLKDNYFYGELPTMKDSTIEFNGKNNIFVCEEGVVLENSRIAFNSDNSIIYLSKNNHTYKLNVTTFYNSVLFIGRNNYINNTVTMVLSEEKNIIIGNDGMMSLNVWFRTSDVHLLYNIDDEKRINKSKSIYVGDHVWLGQNCFLLKGTMIGSGSMIGANALLSNKKIPSNVVATQQGVLKTDTFWDPSSSHNWNKKKTKEWEHYPKNAKNYIFESDKKNISFETIEDNLQNIDNVQEKYQYLLDTLVPANKNRFYIENTQQQMTDASVPNRLYTVKKKNKFTKMWQKIKLKITKILQKIKRKMKRILLK